MHLSFQERHLAKKHFLYCIYIETHFYQKDIMSMCGAKCTLPVCLQIRVQVAVLTVSSAPEMLSWKRPSWWAAVIRGLKTLSES